MLAIGAVLVLAGVSSVKQGPSDLSGKVLFGGHRENRTWSLRTRESLVYPLPRREPVPRIFDVVIYNGELDMLLFRYKVH